MKTHPFWMAICLHIAVAFNSHVLGPGTGTVLSRSLLTRPAIFSARVHAWCESRGLRHSRRGAASLVRRGVATHHQSTSQYGDSRPKSTPVRGQALANGAETVELADTAAALQRQLMELENHLTQITKAVEAVCSLEQVQQLVQQRARDDDIRPRNAMAGPQVGTATLNASEEHPWIAAIADTGLDPSRFQAAKPDTVEQHTVRPPGKISPRTLSCNGLRTNAISALTTLLQQTAGILHTGSRMWFLSQGDIARSPLLECVVT